MPPFILQDFSRISKNFMFLERNLWRRMFWPIKIDLVKWVASSPSFRHIRLGMNLLLSYLIRVGISVLLQRAVQMRGAVNGPVRRSPGDNERLVGGADAVYR
jgi:hypothetical protein